MCLWSPRCCPLLSRMLNNILFCLSVLVEKIWRQATGRERRKSYPPPRWLTVYVNSSQPQIFSFSSQIVLLSTVTFTSDFWCIVGSVFSWCNVVIFPFRGSPWWRATWCPGTPQSSSSWSRSAVGSLVPCSSVWKDSTAASTPSRDQRSPWQDPWTSKSHWKMECF